ncbi:MAG TPA: hypothetical protein PKU97_06465 [Kofleriaceae bacterium]|nr:hypothetical protein [Kofleriaceae bacterium]
MAPVASPPESAASAVEGGGTVPATSSAPASATRELVDTLETSAAPKNREQEADKARERSALRYRT